MNRFLTFPLIGTLFVFAAVFYANRSTGEPAGEGLASARSVASTYDAAELLSIDDAKTLVLDQWPFAKTPIMSRAFVMPTLQADIGFAQLGTSSDHSFFGTLWIQGTSATKKSGETSLDPNSLFAIHVDRVARQAHIYADGWKPYSEWRNDNLPRYKEATGWAK